MQIPFLDLYAANRRHENAFFRELKALYRQSAFVGGPHVENFEREFARFMDANYCVAVASGTSALHLSLAASDTGPGDEVIVPAFTFPGTAWGILYQGATPVFADVGLEDGCLDPEDVVRKITRRTRAIIAVHLFGHPASMDALRQIARERRLILIEDAAQAHGGAYGGHMLGSLGDFGCFSFYPTKNLGGLGDGGAILVKRKSVAERLRRLRDHGQQRRFLPEEVGFNARMDAVQALFLRLKLPWLQSDNEKRATIAARYLTAIRKNPSLPPLEPIKEGKSAWHCFVVRSVERTTFLKHLEKRNVGHQIYYPAILPSLKPFRAFARGNCPAAEELAQTCVALPLHPLMKETEIGEVMKVLEGKRSSA